MKAAEALGDAALGREALQSLASTAPTKQNIVAVISAIRALGHFAAAVPTLVAIVRRDRPTRGNAERLSLHLATVGSAVNALETQLVRNYFVWAGRRP
jgi:hypothetical protein